MDYQRAGNTLESPTHSLSPIAEDDDDSLSYYSTCPGSDLPFHRDRTASRPNSPIPFCLDSPTQDDWHSDHPSLPWKGPPVAFQLPAAQQAGASGSAGTSTGLPLQNLLPVCMEAMGTFDAGAGVFPAAQQVRIGFSGVRGAPYLQFRQQMCAQQASRRAAEQARGVDLHAGSEMMAVEMNCPPHSAAQQQVASIREALAPLISTADLGWYPDKFLPANLVTLLTQEHANPAAAVNYMNHRMEVMYDPIYKAAKGVHKMLSAPSLMAVLGWQPHS